MAIRSAPSSAFVGLSPSQPLPSRLVPEQIVSAPSVYAGNGAKSLESSHLPTRLGSLAAVAFSLVAARASGRRSKRKIGRASRDLRVHSRGQTLVATNASSSGKADWLGYDNQWEVHKFGGASLATAELYKTCGDLLLSQSDGKIPTAAVVSASGKMTDMLVSVVNASVDNLQDAAEQLDRACAHQISVLMELVPNRPDLTGPIIANIEKDKEGVLAMLQATSMMRGIPPQLMELVAGLGEVWSAQTLASYLSSTGVQSGWIDARDVLIVPDAGVGGLGEKGQALDTIVPMWDTTAEKLQSWWSKNLSPAAPGAQAPFLVITGFICTTNTGRPTTLKRSGSDYSATIFAKVLDASKVSMWKNVNGVYTADPRAVPDAFPIPSMTFDEAMELAYFGGQVLHPSAMMPCIEKRIPVLVRNVFNPAHPGTRVYGRGDEELRWPDQEDLKADEDFPVKAITSIEKVELVTISGASFMGTPGVARKMMEALGNVGVSVILTSQGSSEHSITVAVDEADGKRAEDVLKQAFALELAREQGECRVSRIDDCSILAVIGEGMKHHTGISGRFLNALGRAKVNVIAIAQGSSERNISVVVPRSELSRALKAAHAGFTLSNLTLAVGIIGSGKVGTEFMKQLANFQQNGDRNQELPAMAEVERLNIEVRAVCDDKNMLLAEKGMPPEAMSQCQPGVDFNVKDWEKGSALSDDYHVSETDLTKFVDFMDTKDIPHKVLIDCTADDDVAAMYPEWLKRGLHIVSPNKRMAAGPLKRYQECLDATSDQAQWKFCSAVGGQMPVGRLIRDLVQTGDRILGINGIFSGTFSHIFNSLNRNPGKAFSDALMEAQGLGLTEPNPGKDMSGVDTASKALILARELGLELELEDVQVESLLPDSLVGVEGDALFDGLKRSVDGAVAAKLKEAADKDEYLCYVGSIDAAAGKVSVGLQSFPKNHPLVNGQGAETMVSFITERYPVATPLVVQGPGAGAVPTASGVFASLLRLSKGLSS